MDELHELIDDVIEWCGDEEKAANFEYKDYYDIARTIQRRGIKDFDSFNAAMREIIDNY